MDYLRKDSLREAVHPELAWAVRACAQGVLERWEEAVRTELPAADDLTLAQLRDDLPHVLERLAKALESVEAQRVEDMGAVSSAHGAVRFHQSYNLGELFVEYDLLRRVLITDVTNHLARPVAVDEIVALNMGLDLSQRRSVLAFVAHQNRELRNQSEAMSKYLSFLSHDLRGSLNGVLLMAEALRRQLGARQEFAEQMADLDAMRRAILDTVATMERFLHAERFRKGKVQVRPAPVSLQTLVGAAAAHYAYQAKDKGVELAVEMVGGDRTLTSDKSLLNLILQNLLANAIKFSPRGQRVVVRGACAGATASPCRISVVDHGPGIDPDKLSTLFAPFTRGETHEQPGVGLGLSIARQAADLLGVRLWAESSVGHGSAFHFEVQDYGAKDEGRRTKYEVRNSNDESRSKIQ
ncbi:MAG: sensor histidine kinase [Tepidisphaeraceae bacterium]